MKRTSIGGALLLFLAACIWGFVFVAQRLGMNYMGPFTFNGARFLIGGIVLLPEILLRRRRKPEVDKDASSFMWKGGLYCGLALCELYMLCVGEGFSIGKGDIFTIVCAILFSVHILLIDYFSPGAKAWSCPLSSSSRLESSVPVAASFGSTRPGSSLVRASGPFCTRA